MPWIMEVKIATPTGAEWRAVRSTSAPAPYTYDTRHEAETMLRICYPDQSRDEARVRELTEEEVHDDGR